MGLLRVQCLSLLLQLLVTTSRGSEVVNISNIALGRSTFSSSVKVSTEFSTAYITDGLLDTQWQSVVNDYPSHMLVDLGAPSIVTGMEVSSGNLSGGFETLKTYRSLDGLNWTLIRQETSSIHCSAGVTTDHNGWPEETRYVFIQMEERCAGIHFGSFSLAEWKVLGRPVVDMVLKFEKSWPHCADLRPCFSFVDLEDAKRTCLGDPQCDGFSFSEKTIRSGKGDGCYKTNCGATWRSSEESRDAEQLNMTTRRKEVVSLGRGSFGYWEKRRTSPMPVCTALRC
eukprot:TRINITY_DN63855_c0_g1_i1.p1 TRINITY_DN63855_c0_g1~~TRINITY_DN63855_c0_g1_i1.p1  ORF type:complete len:284 (-),score=40.55 TRINITY_DN63855_c0_g1_i1:130-981(-)